MTINCELISYQSIDIWYCPAAYLNKLSTYIITYTSNQPLIFPSQLRCGTHQRSSKLLGHGSPLNMMHYNYNVRYISISTEINKSRQEQIKAKCTYLLRHQYRRARLPAAFGSLATSQSGSKIWIFIWTAKKEKEKKRKTRRRSISLTSKPPNSISGHERNGRTYVDCVCTYGVPFFFLLTFSRLRALQIYTST